MLWTVRILGFFLLLVTLLPLFSTGKWWVRGWDFPRFQIAVTLLIPLTLAVFLVIQKPSAREPAIWVALLIGSLVWQTAHVIQFSPLWSKEVPASDGDAPTIRLLISNLDYENGDREPVSQQLSENKPDVLLLVEFDQDWKDQLTELRSQFKFHHEEVRGEGLGMALWSDLPINQIETRFLVSERRPSIWAQLELDSGQRLNFIGVHPTPPGLLDSTGETRRDSRVRDAELILIAKEVSHRNDEEWVIAGDFNDVAWSHTTRLFKRVSGLRDPRVGRSFMGTYMAEYPPLRCPIDHVFLSKGFSIADLSRKRISGSDHFAVLATVSLEQAIGVDPEMEGNDQEDSQKIIEAGKDDAEERGLSK